MKTSLSAVLWLGALSALHADILYQQPSVWSTTGGTGTGYTDEESAAGTGFRVFDDFTLASAGTINQVSWVGLYINGTVFLNEPPNTTSWNIDLYANNAGVPGTVLSDTSLTAAEVTSQVLGSGTFGGATFTMYQFTADIPDFNAAAGTTYWFSPFSENPDESTKFIWVDGTGGTNTAYDTRLTNGGVTATFTDLSDRAFSLSSVPEPSSIALMAAGLVLAAFMRKRI
jgi:hypothetical protein